ncbi:MAG TPA: hypothetical protein VGE51_08525 [Fontimonas sp.]
MDTALPVFLLLSLIALGGLTFLVLAGRKRQTPQGTVNAPAPGSPESPLFAEPDEKPKS